MSIFEITLLVLVIILAAWLVFTYSEWKRLKEQNEHLAVSYKDATYLAYLRQQDCTALEQRYAETKQQASAFRARLNNAMDRETALLRELARLRERITELEKQGAAEE